MVLLLFIMNLFILLVDCVKVMGIYGFVCVGGGSIGVLFGGLLMSMLSWYWIFLVNLLIGVVVYVVCVVLLFVGKLLVDCMKLDVVGVIVVIVFLMLVVYVVVYGNEVGWMFM